MISALGADGRQLALTVSLMGPGAQSPAFTHPPTQRKRERKRKTRGRDEMYNKENERERREGR